MFDLNCANRRVFAIFHSMIIRREFFLKLFICSTKKNMYSTVPYSTLSFWDKNLILNIFPRRKYITYELVITQQI